MGKNFFRNANILPPSHGVHDGEDAFEQLTRTRYKKHPYQCKALIRFWLKSICEETGVNLSLSQETITEQECISVSAHGLLYLLTYAFRRLNRYGKVPAVSLVYDENRNPVVIMEAEKNTETLFKNDDFIDQTAKRLGEVCGFWVSCEETADRFRVFFQMKRFRCEDFSLFQEIEKSAFSPIKSAITEENKAFDEVCIDKNG